MKYLKINNFYNKFDQPDYKGLALNQIVPGSQLYPIGATYALLATNEELPILPTDVVEITEEQYITEKVTIKNNIKQSSQSIADRISSVEVAIANLMGV